MENTSAPAAANRSPETLLTKRNFWCFALGTFGRDFAYNLFTGSLLTFILFTKTLSDAQFSCVSIIIVAARIFDAFNDPVMGGIVENTRTRLGKFRPWILTGGTTTAIVIILLFSVPVDNWGFIGFLAAMYFAFSITFTMNDISYWALLPHLARDTHERNKLSSVTQLVVTAGGGLAGIMIPALTTTYSRFLGNSARNAYMWISVIAALLFTASTLVTFLGVNDHTQVAVKKSKRETADENDKVAAIAKSSVPDEKLSLKDMFRVLKNNDQLLIAAIIMIIFSVGTSTAGAILTTYLYFMFNYNGLLATLFGTFSAVITIIFTATFPWIIKKIGRTNLIKIGGLLIIAGYAIMLIVGLTVPMGKPLFSVMGLDFTLKFFLLSAPFALTGLGGSCYYNMMFLNIANTVEYNEWKTGKREESLIFSLRPFTAKMSSALQQLFVMIVYLAIGVLDITRGISSLDQSATAGKISNTEMLSRIGDLLHSVPQAKITALLCSLCLIPIAFMTVAMLLYKFKFKLDDNVYEDIKAQIAARNASAPTSALTAPASEAAASLAPPDDGKSE